MTQQRILMLMVKVMNPFAVVPLSCLRLVSSLLLLMAGCRLTAQLEPSPTKPYLHYHALVIGINDYAYWGDLRRAKKDAESVAEVLEDRYGFSSVIRLLDEQATVHSIEAALRDFVTTLDESDALLVYFAGHGHFDNLLGQGFWIPSDGRMTIGDRPAVTDWIENDRILQYLGKCKARHILVVSDACFSGSLFRGNHLPLNPASQAWYQHAIARPSRWAITSGDMELVPDAGVFGMKFLQLLKYPPRSVFSVSDLASWLMKEVTQYDGTFPQSGPLHDPSHQQGGEFIFVENNAEADFWKQIPGELESAEAERLVTGRLHVFSNLNCEVRLDDRWLGQVVAGETMVFDRIAGGMHQIQVRAANGALERSVMVGADTDAYVNAVFDSSSAGKEPHHRFPGWEGESLYLSMDDEDMHEHFGALENRGALVTRDAIRGNALRLRQGAYLAFDGLRYREIGSRDFAISLWFNWLDSNHPHALLALKGDAGHGLCLRLENRHVEFTMNDPQMESPPLLQSETQVEALRWHHVLVSRSGDHLELWVNGKLESELTLPVTADGSSERGWLFGNDPSGTDGSFDGSLDEIQIFERSLKPVEIEAAYRLKFEKFRLSRQRYSEREELDLIVKKLYGATSRIADWSEVISRFGTELPEFMNFLGLREGERFWITYFERRFYASTRHFFAVPVTERGTLEVEEYQYCEGGAIDFALSSWVGLELPMLVEL